MLIIIRNNSFITTTITPTSSSTFISSIQSRLPLRPSVSKILTTPPIITTEQDKDPLLGTIIRITDNSSSMSNT
jgi:hypothetical protein